MSKKNFRFSDPFLMKFSFEINDKFDIEGKEELNIEQRFHVRIKRNKQENHATVILDLELGTKELESPFMISVSEGADFEWDENDYTEEQERKLLLQHAPGLLLSYIRPLVASITSASLFPTYHIPYFHFPEADYLEEVEN